MSGTLLLGKAYRYLKTASLFTRIATLTCYVVIVGENNKVACIQSAIMFYNVMDFTLHIRKPKYALCDIGENLITQQWNNKISLLFFAQIPSVQYINMHCFEEIEIDCELFISDLLNYAQTLQRTQHVSQEEMRRW